MTFEVGGEADSPPWEGAPNVIGTTPGRVKLECPHCGREGSVPKHHYHDTCGPLLCHYCGGEVKT